MRYRELGTTGIQISEISFGAWAVGGPFSVGGRAIGWGKVDDKASLEALRRAFDLGVNFVDTADIYGFGHSEEVVGRAIGESGKDIHVASKVGFLRAPQNNSIQDFGASHILKSCEASLKRLNRDHIDLYQLHCVPLEVIRQGEVFSTLEKLQQNGKIRAFGVSIVTDEEALEAMKVPRLQCVQIIFNILRQRPAKTVLPIAREKKIGILARVPLASGLLTGKFNKDTQFALEDHRSNPLYGETFSGLDFKPGLEIAEGLRPLATASGLSMAQMALAWILESDAVTAAIPGAKTAEQAEENCSAFRSKMDKQILSKIEALYRDQVSDLVESVY